MTLASGTLILPQHKAVGALGTKTFASPMLSSIGMPSAMFVVNDDLAVLGQHQHVYNANLQARAMRRN
jgi:hypothetical protein